MKNDSFKEILKMFPDELQNEVYSITANNLESLTEIRIRNGQHCVYRVNEGAEKLITGKCFADNALIVSIYNQFINYSAYAYEHELKKGYITLIGGHRAGICGCAVIENGTIKLLDNISSINLRRASEHKGTATAFYNYIVKKYGIDRNREQMFPNILIVSPPGCGKTTFLRDLIRLISESGINVGICDERSEIAGMYHGEAAFDIGRNTDVLDACPKAEGMRMLLRSMSPDVIATDEIGADDDIAAIKNIAASGIGFLATVHGSSIEEIRKGQLKELIDTKHFNIIVFLKKFPKPCTIYEILNLNDGGL